jgi:N-acetylglucosaminyldiphosphoundecaprenol N-acetyl-beta-D-mannosaminyltransferase
MAVDYPNVRVAGTYSPPFKKTYSKEEVDAMAAAINEAAPDVLWVGMTAPKQEKWIHDQRDRLNVKFAAAIGAVFDFYTGRVKRSHPAFQRLGLEWLPRLVQEPRRLWRRMFVSAPVFLFAVLRTWVLR